MGKQFVLLSGLVILAAVAPVSVGVEGTNVVVSFYTDLEGWTSGGTTVDDTTTAFSANGNDGIKLTTVTDAFTTAPRAAGPCKVDVNQNGQLQVVLNCTIPGQRVVYAAAVSTGAFGQMVPLAFAGYGEVFLANPNTQVTYTHKIYNTNGLYDYRTVTQAASVNSTFTDSGVPFAITYCPIGTRIHDNMRVETPDGNVTANDRHIYNCPTS